MKNKIIILLYCLLCLTFSVVILVCLIIKDASFTSINGIVLLPDGYYSEFFENRVFSDLTVKKAEALVGIRRFAKKKGIDFLYVQAPFKISELNDDIISGRYDFSNQNANKFIDVIEKNQTDTLDLRKNIYDEGLNYHSLFYRTDHHWLTTTGIWAAKKVLEKCNHDYGFSANTDLLNLNRFKQVVYSRWFLGSYGKKLPRDREVEPDDFILLYPKFRNRFHLIIPDKDIDKKGDYSIVYNMEQVSEKDLYNKNPYGACCYGDRPEIIIENDSAQDDKKILFIHDSFGNCMISPFALCEKNIYSLDIRHYLSSVRAYIDKINPDLVIVMYNAAAIAQYDEDKWHYHNNPFDFR